MFFLKIANHLIVRYPQMRILFSLKRLIILRQMTLGTVFCFLVAVQGVLHYRLHLSNITEQVNVGAEKKLSQMRYDLRGIEQDLTEMARSVALLKDINWMANKNSRMTYFQSFVQKNPLNSNTYVAFEKKWAQRLFKKDGYVYLTTKESLKTPSNAEILFYDTRYYSDTKADWYNAPKADNKIHYTSIYFDKEFSKQHVISVTKGIYLENEFIGVVGVDIVVSALKTYFEETSSSSLQFAVVSPDYRLVESAASAQQKQLLQSKNVQSAIMRLDQQHSTGMVVLESGTSVYSKLVDIEGAPFKILVMRNPWDGIMPSLMSFLFMTMLITVAFFVLNQLVSGVSLLFLDSVNSVTNGMEEAVRKLEAGKFEELEPVAVPILKEVAQVAQNFNLFESELKSSIKAMNHARSKAELAVIAKSNFLSSMSHEIRTPLNGMLGSIQLLESTNMDNEQTEYVQMFKESGQSLLALVNDILDFSKVDSGKMVLDMHSFNLLHVLKSIETFYSPLAQKKGIQFKVETNVEGSWYKGDSYKLRQVIQNLLSNALKFTHQGQIKLEVIVHSSGFNKRIKFAVTDTGIGIPEEKLERLFKDFSQVDESTSRKYGGTGLGLSISKKIVELMDGNLQVNSITGLGSKFYFELELEEVQGTEESVEHEVSSSQQFEVVLSSLEGSTKTKAQAKDELSTDIPIDSQTVTPSQQKIEKRYENFRILVVDDIESNHRVVNAFLKKGFAITPTNVSNGVDAIKLIEHQKFDLVFLDIQMPEVSGYQVLEILHYKDLLKKQKIVMLSANCFPEDIEKSISMGAWKHIGKPFNKEELLGLVAQVAAELRSKEPADAISSETPDTRKVS